MGPEYAKFVVANLVLGMGHVHSKNFVFRDLKVVESRKVVEEAAVV